MKRISNEEALNYVPYERTPLSPPPPQYSIFVGRDGWDEVRYYTSRYRQSVNGNNGDQSVYILESESMPGMIKIGYTAKDPFSRAHQISRGTGIPLGFEVEWAYKCFKGERIEQEVHKVFKKQRVNTQKEFFRVSLNEAKQVIEQIGEKYA